MDLRKIREKLYLDRFVFLFLALYSATSIKAETAPNKYVECGFIGRKKADISKILSRNQLHLKPEFFSKIKAIELFSWPTSIPEYHPTPFEGRTAQVSIYEGKRYLLISEQLLKNKKNSTLVIAHELAHMALNHDLPKEHRCDNVDSELDCEKIYQLKSDELEADFLAGIFIAQFQLAARDPSLPWRGHLEASPKENHSRYYKLLRRHGIPHNSSSTRALHFLNGYNLRSERLRDLKGNASHLNAIMSSIVGSVKNYYEDSLSNTLTERTQIAGRMIEKAALAGYPSAMAAHGHAISRGLIAGQQLATAVNYISQALKIPPRNPVAGRLTYLLALMSGLSQFQPNNAFPDTIAALTETCGKIANEIDGGDYYHLPAFDYFCQNPTLPIKKPHIDWESVIIQSLKAEDLHILRHKLNIETAGSSFRDFSADVSNHSSKLIASDPILSSYVAGKKIISGEGANDICNYIQGNATSVNPIVYLWLKRRRLVTKECLGSGVQKELQNFFENQSSPFREVILRSLDTDRAEGMAAKESYLGQALSAGWFPHVIELAIDNSILGADKRSSELIHPKAPPLAFDRRILRLARASTGWLNLTLGHHSFQSLLEQVGSESLTDSIYKEMDTNQSKRSNQELFLALRFVRPLVHSYVIGEFMEGIQRSIGIQSPSRVHNRLVSMLESLKERRDKMDKVYPKIVRRFLQGVISDEYPNLDPISLKNRKSDFIIASVMLLREVGADVSQDWIDLVKQLSNSREDLQGLTRCLARQALRAGISDGNLSAELPSTLASLLQESSTECITSIKLAAAYPPPLCGNPLLPKQVLDLIGVNDDLVEAVSRPYMCGLWRSKPETNGKNTSGSTPSITIQEALNNYRNSSLFFSTVNKAQWTWVVGSPKVYRLPEAISELDVLQIKKVTQDVKKMFEQRTIASKASPLSYGGWTIPSLQVPFGTGPEAKRLLMLLLTDVSANKHWMSDAANWMQDMVQESNILLRDMSNPQVVHPNLIPHISNHYLDMRRKNIHPADGQIVDYRLLIMSALHSLKDDDSAHLERDLTDLLSVATHLAEQLEHKKIQRDIATKEEIGLEDDIRILEYQVKFLHGLLILFDPDLELASLTIGEYRTLFKKRRRRLITLIEEILDVGDRSPADELDFFYDSATLAPPKNPQSESQSGYFHPLAKINRQCAAFIHHIFSPHYLNKLETNNYIKGIVTEGIVQVFLDNKSRIEAK